MKLFPILFCAIVLTQSLVHASDHPNIVVILVDDMGYGDVGAYNEKSKVQTPHLDRLAAEGMRFTDAHAPGPLCHLSRYGLMTGTYPFRTDVTVWPTEPVIRDDEETIADLLSRSGYATAMVGKWHLGFTETGYDNALPGGPIDCGFDSYFGIRASTDIPPYFYIRGDEAVSPPTDTIEAKRSAGWSKIQGEFSRAGGIAPDLALADVLPRFTSEAIDVIEKRDAEKPLFLYLAYPAPHTPWLPSDEFKGTSDAGMYGDFVAMVDAEVGKVFTALADAGMKDDTLVIFTSDNGPVWYDVDEEKYGHEAVGGFRGMKADAWEGGHRMPFLVRWPGVVTAGAVADKTISFTDVLATFSEITGESLSEGAGPDSYSFFDTLSGAAPSPRPPLVLESGRRLMTIRSGNWKLIDGIGSGGFTKAPTEKSSPDEPDGQLYDLASDPAESVNLYDERPDIVSRLEREMAEIIGQ